MSSDDVDELWQMIEHLKAARGAPRILVIDDEENCYKLFSRFMTGCIVDWALTGERGLQILKDNQYDAIVVDEKLPGDPGHEIIKKIRAAMPNVITVLSTSYEFDDHLREEIKNLGPTLFLPKPLKTQNLQTLIAAIDQWRG